MTRPYPRLDRHKLKILPLRLRESKADSSVLVPLEALPPALPEAATQRIQALAQAMINAKGRGAAVILTYGAHLFRNGMSLMIIDLMKRGYLTHLCTNGAGGIHDWELAFHGRTTEDVQKYLQEGQFGIWQETGLYQNLALSLGAAQGLGYGQSLGKLIAEEGLQVPSVADLRKEIALALTQETPENLAGKAALLENLTSLNQAPGKIQLPHPQREASLLFQAFHLGIPLSICPGIGYDIIYNHPANQGASLGQAAVADFLSFADSVNRLEGGVYLSVGSAVMSPMILEKALSMARNLALQESRPLNNYKIAVVDMQPGTWNWAEDGEPPKNNPAYYLRFCKSFSRMGGDFEYFELDNRVFFHNLYRAINSLEA